MSLKYFHILFIAVAVVFCLAFGAWALLKGEQSREVLGMGIFSVALGGALTVYGVLFQRKARRIIT
jgi:multisubunit Na+/H+ antiporter MnhC subunit